MSDGLARGWLAGLALAALASPAAAQISPGPLSRAHGKLEGSTHCLDCHDPKEGVAATKCLACHEPLAKRITAGKGLHARAEYRDCRQCHVEHQGAEFALVYWGKPGQAAFDHALTGHALTGKHARLACTECHKTRSFLGAAAECGSCHRDEHRGQFQGRACTSCHGEQAWKPAPGFDHARTSFSLTGRHAGVVCERCHAGRQPDPKAPGQSYRTFRVAAGRECASCHEDSHKGRLGAACTTCHTTAGWKQAKTAGFDHDRTGYPLAGRHRGIACQACHKPGQPMRIKHERCSDCHADAHGGVLAARGDAGRCESCHAVDGWRPAHFGPEDHAKTAYPLRGAHLAVACDECHKGGATTPAAGTRAASAQAASASAARVPLKLSATSCSDCHRDPHAGETRTLSAQKGCETCHRVDAWREVAFDHARTHYPLTGQHASVACGRCHARAADAGAHVSFRGAATQCEACHRDRHDTQFAAAGRTACERCHATDSLRATRFSHARDSRYPLDGAHARLACDSCHKRDVQGIIRYKPLPVACAGCHAARPKAANGGVP